MDVKETVAVAAAEGAAATALGDDATIVVSTKEMDSAKTIDIAPAEKLKDLTDDLTNNIKENADGIDNLDDEIIEEKASTQNVKAASITSTTETSTTAKAVPIKNGTTSTNADSKLEVSSSAEDANVDDDDANEKVAAVREPPKGDDQLIQELEEIEGLKKVDDATNAAILLETGILDSEMQKTSDLLKDLEGDIQDGQIDDVRNDEQQAEIDDAIKSIVEAKDGTEVDKGGDGNGTDIVGGVDGNDDNDNNDVDADNDVLVDSTSESNLKRKHSTDEITGNPTKKQNISIDDVSTNTVKDDGKIEQPTTSDKNKTNVKMDILQATKDDADCIVGDVANSQPNSTATKEIEAAISSTSNDSCSKMTSKLCEMIENSKTSPDVLHTDAKDGNKLKTDSQEVSSTGEEKTKQEGEIKLVKKSAEEADSSDGKTTKITAAATRSATATADNKMDKYISDSTVSVDSSFDGLFSADSAHCDNGKKVTEDVEEKMDVDEDDSILDSKDKDNNKIENKLLKTMMNNGSSTPNTSDTMTSVTTASIAAVATASEASTAETPTVFNSTPIQKEFEISSENVSKISESGEQSQTDKSLTEAIECDMMCSSDDHTADELTIKSSSTGSDVPSESLTRYANVLKKYNGLTDAISEDSSIDQLAEKPSQETNNKSIANGTNLDTTQLTADPNSRVYEIHIMYEDNEMTFMALENVERKKKSSSSLIGSPTTDAVGSDTSGKHSLSTNSSVGSVGPFNLPGNRITPTSSSLSSELSHEKFAVPSNVVLPQQHIKKTIKGMTALCNFMIDHFSQIKKRVDLNDSVDESDHRSMVQHKGRKSAGKKNLNESDSGFDIEAATSATATTPKAGGKRNAQKRSLDKNVSDSEDEPKVKQTKGSKKSSKIDQTPTKHQTTANDESKLELSVLARWVDKKYYAGRITESKPGNKFVVLFEDGASKVLPQESIVFGGEDDILPLLNQSVHALVDEETYEPGLVESTSKDGDIVYYTVIAESKTVKVTSSEIYLEDDQAKVIQSLNLGKMNELLKTPDTPSSTKRAGRPSIKLEESQASPLSVGGGAAGGGGVGGSSSGGGGGSGAGRGRPKKSTTAATTQQQSSTSAMATPEPSTSGTGGSTSGRKGRRAKRPEPPPPRFSESSDISDLFDTDNIPPSSPEYALEAVGGVDPELQLTPKESEINKKLLIAEYLGHDQSVNVDNIIGPMPDNKILFRNKHFILTCTLSRNRSYCNEDQNDSDNPMRQQIVGLKAKGYKFSNLPFVKYHLRLQIEAGGGKVYDHFEDIPKNKYKFCKLIAPQPCATAKYVQCLAANIPAISHEWIIQSCKQNTTMDARNFALPAGWSIIENQYKRWTAGKANDQRISLTAFNNTCIILASYQKAFTEFWSRVFKLAGGTVRLVKSVNDLTTTTKGVIVADDEFPEDIRSKAIHLNIPIVSTVWAVQSLILGEPCEPNSSVKLQQMYLDDD